MCDLLLLAAHPLELAGFEPFLGPSLVGRVGQVSVRCAAVGVGLVAAAVGTGRALAAHRPSAAVLVGSYGSFPGRPSARGELAVVSDFRWVDAAVDGAKAEFPGPVETHLVLDSSLRARLLAGLPAVPSRRTDAGMATVSAITTCDGLARTYARRLPCHGENLEGFSVALACREAGVPMAALLADTNEVGADGRSQWLANHRSAATLTAAAIVHWLTTERADG